MPKTLEQCKTSSGYPSSRHGKKREHAVIVRGIFLIVEDYAPLFSEENLFLVEMFDETFNIWHIYSL